jgi:UDP-N-acetylglucosamine--N-acetylmuramyl-(pentapeptide) pyrophosphoryl-undecaprenol N-acetylglucosamine transferase
MYTIRAGKFRRYHSESWLQRLLDVKTIFLNVRDMAYASVGVLQAMRLLRKVRPDVVFLKGGFVGVPVGVAARSLHIPFVTHDSDAIPGLANRMVGRWATIHATALPAEHYRQYDASSVRQVGVLVEHHYQPVTPDIQKEYKRALALPEASQILLVTGGSSGAQRLNDVMKTVTPMLLNRFPDLNIIHQVGKGNAGAYGDYEHDRLRVVEFMQPMYQYTGAADLVITRAGANTLAEFGVQGKACIVIPSRFLSGGHQLKNAAHLETQHAIVQLDEMDLESNPALLGEAVAALLEEPAARQQLAANLQALTIPDAAAKLADILLTIGKT